MVVPKMAQVAHLAGVSALTSINTKAVILNIAPRPWLMAFQSSSASEYLGMRIDIGVLYHKSLHQVEGFRLKLYFLADFFGCDFEEAVLLLTCLEVLEVAFF